MCTALAIAGCGSSAVPQLKGEPEVYQQIDQNTDCVDLQATFDRADINRAAALARNNTALADVTLSYMDASYDRMVALSCPGQ